MATAYISEIRIFSFGFAPKNWALCNGQLLPINQNQALFSLLGTTYGGNGINTFALPNLQGRTPMHTGTAPGGSQYVIGQTAGEVNHTLLLSEMPAHNHQAIASSNAPTASTPASNFWASNTSYTPYGNLLTQTMAANAIGNAGGSQAHNNMAPYLTLNICICLYGIFPSRN